MTRTFKELAMVSACFAYALVRTGAQGKVEPRDTMRVVIVQLAKLGDMVCTTPMFRAIKQKYPNTHVTVVGDSINKRVLECNPDVDEYIVFEGVFSLMRHLRKGHYDFGCATVPGIVTLAALFLGNVRTIAMPKAIPKEKSDYSPLESVFYHKTAPRLAIIKPHHMRHYGPREYLRLLEPLDILTEDTKKHLGYSKVAQQKAESFLAPLKRPVVGVAPAAGHKIKQWPPERFAAVADELVRAHGATVVVFGGPRDREEVESMLAHCKEGMVNALEKFSIDELKAVIAQLTMFIAVDTGPIYIAEAFNIPTIDITGPIEEREQPPIGKYHRVVPCTDRMRPELYLLNAKSYDYIEARRQTESISTGRVVREVESLFVSLNNERKFTA